ncbi:MAG: LytTR family DNA-binding domain-containing protein [Bacilli bacterium]
MNLTIAIVEDETIWSDKTQALCQRFSDEKKVSFTAEVFKNAYDFLEHDFSRFDMVFMDIDMPGLNGMEATKKIRLINKTLSIVFVTNLPQFALDGYKVGALDFILKPMTYADFYLVMEKITQVKKNENHGFFLLTIYGVITKFMTDEIEYIEMVKHDVLLHKKDGSEIQFRGSLKAFEKDLNSQFFLRCNSGIVVNLMYVKSIKEDVILMESSALLVVSRSRKKDFMNALSTFFSYSNAYHGQSLCQP